MTDEPFEFPIGMPEAIKEQVQRMVDRQQMVHTVTRQQVSRLFKDITNEHLETLGNLFHALGENPHAAIFYEGFAKSLLAERTGVWPGWDQDDGPMGVEVALSEDGILVHTVPIPPDPEGNMALYNMEPSTDREGGVRCKNCGLEYISLEDRMLRRPDQCHGCQIKTKWG